MGQSMWRHLRSGMTLVELLVVIAIIGTLVGLLLPTVQKVRELAKRIDTSNRLRQVILATHQFAGEHQSYWPGVNGYTAPGIRHEYSNYMAILPYLEQGNIYAAFRERFPGTGINSEFVIPTYISPSDPSIESPNGLCSFAANAILFKSRTTLDHCTDGLSGTIAHVERYSIHCNGVQFTWGLGDFAFVHPPLPNGLTTLRPATFADSQFGDIIPVVGPDGTTRASVGGLTFQPRPALPECNPRIPQGLHPGGMVVSMADGSVRVISPGVSESVFWGSVTPAGGEVVSLD